MTSKTTKRELAAQEDLERWSSLSREEKLAEFNDLAGSHYWSFLPQELRARIRRFLL